MAQHSSEYGDYSDSMVGCRTPLSNMAGYSNMKLSEPYQPSIDVSRPRMASLLENAWKAKSLKMKRTGLISQYSPVRNNAVVQVAKQIKQKPCLACLLSRRLGINTSITVKIPPKKPFPPPLQWKPSIDPQYIIFRGTT